MDIISLLLGWFLGLFSPIIVDRIKVHYRKEEFRKGLLIELKELRHRLVALVHKMTLRFGNYDRKFLMWLEPLVEKYEGSYPTENIVKCIVEHLKLGDKELLAIAQHYKSEGKSVLTLKKHSLPFLNSRIDFLPSFDSQFQLLVLEIRAQLDILNDASDNARFNHEKTFDSSISKENYDIVCQNLEAEYRNIGEISRRIVDKISAIISH